MLIPLKIPPGIYRNGTNYQAQGRWYDASLVRFFEGTIRPVGGWRRPVSGAVSGLARGMFPWRDYGTNRWVAIGTHSGLYIYNGGSLYDVTPSGFSSGRADSLPGNGFGGGVFGTGAFGAAPVVVGVLDATTWSFDNWGQYLVGCSNYDGKLYQWELNTGTIAAAISGAPTGCVATMVTAERYQLALGASSNPRQIKWCDQEVNTTWTPSSTNTAGDVELQTNGRIRCGRRLPNEVLIWTDTDVHSLQYVGPPFIYAVRRVGGFCGIAGPNAVAVIEAGAAWMGGNGFFYYDGALRDIPCDVSDYVFGDINLVQLAKVYAGHNSKFGEVWWFYCSSASDEVDRYVTWNYREKTWNIGSLARTCWADSGVFPYPMAVDSSGYVYEHEYGWTNNGTAITTGRYATSGPVELGTGDQVMAVRQMVPDEKTSGQVNMTFTTKFTPEGDTSSYGPYTPSAYTDMRFTGRQVAMQLLGATDADWRVGNIRLDAVAGGRR